MRFLGIVILSGIFCLFYSHTARSAEIKVVDNNVFVETDTYQVQFTDGVITHLSNKLTEETYTLPLGVGGVTGFRGRSGLLKRDGNSLWTDQATLTGAKKVAPLRAEIMFRQGRNEFRLFIGVDARSGDLLIEQEGTSEAAGVYGIQWGCGNLNVRNLDLILPARGGQIIDAQSPIISRTFTYPGLWKAGIWEAQLAVLQGKQGGFFVRSTDATFQFKALHYERDRESFSIGFETQNQAPFDALTSAKSVIWRLNTYTGNWRVPARQYRNWMEQTFKPWRLDQMPSWVQEVGLVVNLLGLLDTNVLDKLAEHVDPTKTLLYLVDWTKEGHDMNYPEYTPKIGFAEFVKAAHRYGFRVMPHTNLVGVSPYHPLYAEFKKSQFRDEWHGGLIGWKWEQTESPHRHAWINLADSKFRKLFVQQLKEIWEKYRVDAFYLDISHAVINDANGLIEGLTAAQGNVQMHLELAEAMPGVVFGGEGLHEVTFFRESFAQRWSVSPWHGEPSARPHPISSFLFSPYTLPYGYLGLPNPDVEPQLYQEFLASYESWGVLPTLRLRRTSQLEPEHANAQKLLSIARAWQELGLKPDFETDWGPETLFQYVGQGGESATLSATDGGTILHLPQEDIGYERVFGVTQVRTHRSLPHWHAYNETKILGLNPKQSYFLSDALRDFSQVHINSLPEGVFVTQARVTENAALFRLERADVSHEIDLLSQFHLLKTRIVVNGEELRLQKGARFEPNETSIAGVQKATIWANLPWQGISGNTFGEWTLSLPESPHVRLEFDIGLWDGPGHEKSDGGTFIVSIQGNEIFREHRNQRVWKHISVDLTAYQGQQVTLRFTTNPGPNGDPGWDWPVWGEPRIVSEPSDTSTKIGFYLPTEPIRNVPDTVKSIGQGQYSLETKLPAQILFLFEPAEQVVAPYNLRDAEFITGLQFDSIFQMGSFESSGEPTIVDVEGIRKESIVAHPPRFGQTVLQFLLSLPQAERMMFSFSMGLQDGCSNGVSFTVLVNGETRFEHFTNTFEWEDANISLTEQAGDYILLELITDPGENYSCDWAFWADLFITAKGVESSGDVNQDGIVNVLDIILVAQNLGQKQPFNPSIDVNKDGQINVLDLVFVAERLGEKVAAAPSQMDASEATPSSSEDVIVVRRALAELEAIPGKSQSVEMTLQFLRAWLANADQGVRETRLLPNYPNPFNPETWIPYQLADATDVSMTIYDVSGHLVRTISVGFKPVGYYLTRQRAAYWDGRNETGEPVSSGVYFLRFLAGDFTATQRVVIVK